MKKIDEMKSQLQSLKTSTQKLPDENKLEEAKASMKDIRELKAKIDVQEELDVEEMQTLASKVKSEKGADKGNCAGVIRAMIKKMVGYSLTDAENALLLPTTGEHGEGYILPQDISTIIHKKIRDYRSLRDVVGHIPAGALTGSFPVEGFETVSELIDFADGTDGTFSDDISFTNVNYALKEKAAFIKLSNTLLSMSDNNLIAYVAEVFAKKAVITENEMIINALTNGKTAKSLTTWNALKSGLNKDLDPAVLYNACIVTNQDGFDFLDAQLDGTGRPILQTNPANATQKLFNGYPVHVYSNAMLPTTAKKAPVFYRNLNEAVKFVDYKGLIRFAVSGEAGFMSNTTIARLIEFIDAIQVDKSDKCYIYGQLTVA